MNNKKTWWIVLIISISVLFGLLIGNVLAVRNLENRTSTISLPALFGGSKEGKLDEMLNIIGAEYVDTISTTDLKEDLAFSLANSLDPHSVYIPAKELKEVQNDLEGSFSGIGVQFNIQNDTVMIVAVISGGPSEKVGLLAGDRIVAVNDSAFVGKTITSEKVQRTLKGAKNTKVKLAVKRNGTREKLTYTVTRGDIPVNSVVAAYIIAPKTGFIRVNNFGAKTYKEFLNAIATLKQQGAAKFIVDLRENSGGYMDAAINMTNEFLKRGEMIVYAEGRSYKRFDAKADGKGTCIDAPLAVLIDDFSASASEIFAGAIQDNDRGVIIGRRSFGKGLVQQRFQLSDGSAFQMTVAYYYTPSGRSVQKPYTKGKTADYEMDLLNRYMHGEFDNADSIHLNTDTLIYNTLHGRKVYGGGGIMPDIFVPRDTSEYSPYLNKAMNQGFLYQFAFQYTDSHRELLTKFKSWRELKKYLENQSLLSDFVSFTESKNLKPSPKDMDISKNIITSLLQSYIVRNILGDEGFYPLFYMNDKTVLKAVEELKTKN
jgi:carboxyl-terminal processing protease